MCHAFFMFLKALQSLSPISKPFFNKSGTLTLAKCQEVLLLSMSAYSTEYFEPRGADTYPGILFVPTKAVFSLNKL